MTPEEIAQELEIDYDTSLKGRVYPEFTQKPEDIYYDPIKYTFISIDNSH